MVNSEKYLFWTNLKPNTKPVNELRFGLPDNDNTWYVWFANLGLIILILAMLALRNDLLDRTSSAPEENSEMENQNSTQQTPIQLNTTLRLFVTTPEPVLFSLTEKSTGPWSDWPNKNFMKTVFYKTFLRTKNRTSFATSSYCDVHCFR